MIKMENQTTFSFSTEEKESILNDFENYLRAEGQRLNTIRGNSSSARVFLDWTIQENINYLEITYTDLLAYIDHHKARGNTKNTINGKLQGIKHFYNYLQQKELVGFNPAEELRIKNVITRQPHDLIDWEDLEQLYKNYPTGSITGKRNKTILGMMIYQGLNSGEVAAIELKDVKLEEAKVYVPSVARSNSRTLKLESLQILQLQKYITQVRPVLLAMTDKKSEKLFTSSGDGNRLDNSLTRLMRATRKLNTSIKNPKQIRASVITHWLKIHNIRQVQYMTGHRYVSSTERYRTDLLETLQEQIDELHPLQ
jgi:integrase/recombinase XerD